MRYPRPTGNGNKYGIDVKAGMIHTKPEVLVLLYDSVFTHKSSYYYELPDNRRMFKAGNIICNFDNVNHHTYAIRKEHL
jgi:hypothetical protein